MNRKLKIGRKEYSKNLKYTENVNCLLLGSRQAEYLGPGRGSCLRRQAGFFFLLDCMVSVALSPPCIENSKG